MKIRNIAAIAAGVAALGLAGAASAATYTSFLEYRDGVVGPQTPYGTVSIEEVDANTLRVLVTLANPASLFVNTGGPHDPFLFNLAAPATFTFNNQPGQEFAYAGDGAYQATPYGIFTDKISCCQVYVPEKKQGKTIIPAHYEDGNGRANGDAPPLEFLVYNAGGLTFAGIGAQVDPVTGRLLATGTGNQFASNAGGWWFAADIYDGATGKTYNVAARDAFRSAVNETAVPEPGAWALMIAGFGAVGAVLRRRPLALARA